MTSQNTPSLQTRRNWLRDAAIAATSTAVLPSFLTSCTDHRVGPGKGGLGSELLTDTDLEKARGNLMKMKTWYVSVQLNTSNYETTVWALLNSGQKPKDWDSIAISIIIKFIGAGLAMFAGPFAPIVAATFAVAVDLFNAWEAEKNPPPGLYPAYAEIALALDGIKNAVIIQLNTLADPNNHYQNLRDYFQEKGEGGIKVGDKNYTLSDLVASTFPEDNTEAYANIWSAGVIQQKQIIWRLLLTKAGKLNFGRFDSYELKEEPNYTPTEFARDQFYREHKGGYLRGYYEKGYYYLRAWYFEVDGKRLTNDAAKELFIDDTPGHIMSVDATGKPNGLLPRDFVFKQFHTTKPDFSPFHELRKNSDLDPRDTNTSRQGFDHDTDDFAFPVENFPA